MGKLDGRIKKLELRLIKPERCETCQEWPAERFVIEDRSSSGDDSLTAGPGVPEACPDCGWKPKTLIIVIEDDDPEEVAV